MLNLTHRESREHPSALAPGEPVDVRARARGRPRGRSSRATGCGSTSPARTGRTRGRRPSRCTLTIDRASAVLELPVLDGPSPVDGTPLLAAAAARRPPDAVAEDARRSEDDEGVSVVGHARGAHARSRRRTPGARSPDEATRDVPAMRSTTTASSRSRPTTRASRRRPRRGASSRCGGPRRPCESLAPTSRSPATPRPTTRRSTWSCTRTARSAVRRRWERAIPRDLT